jgi:putative phosphoesterase
VKVAIISDVHDNVWNLERVLAAISRDGAQALIMCGDFCAPFTLRQIATSFAGPVHAVFGNNDGDRWLLSRVAAEAGCLALYGDYAELQLDGAKVFVCHYQDVGRHIAASGRFQAVFYGHSHVAELTQGPSLALNPGEVMGRFGKVTYGLYDTAANEGSICEL